MLEQHTNKEVMLDQQEQNSANYVLPFIEKSMKINADTKVLDVGCGEGGVLHPFLKRGCQCLGVDLNTNRFAAGRKRLAQYFENGQLAFSGQNVYDESFVAEHKNKFDIIILKDVIEHVPDQEKFIPHLKTFLRPGGQIFFGFPPWYMPFGGHQQLLTSKWASKLPYYHILPNPLYKGIMKVAGEKQSDIDFMILTKDTQISIERFERIVRQNNFEIKQKQWFLINPIYKYKFGLKPRKQNWLFGAIPGVRNFLTSCAYYTIQP